MLSYAYIHARPDGTPFYVGKGRGKRATTFSPGYRSDHHANVVAKHGRKNILIGKIECSSEPIAFDLERGLIKCLRRSGVELVNHTDGGEGASGHRCSDETKRKIGARTRGVVPSKEVCEARRLRLLGTKASAETRAKMSASQRGRVDSPETKLKKSVAAKGKPKSEEHRRKVRLAVLARPPMSEETRAKLRATSKAAWEKRKAGSK